jgi:pyrophosphatase PpaX
VGVREAVSALLFDFDGTIVNTAQLWSRTTRTCFAARGFDLDDAMLDRVLVSAWRDVLPALSESDALAIEDDMVLSIREAYLCCPPAVGLDTLLGTFAGVPKAIVTSSYRDRLVTPYLRRHGLSRHFSVVVGSEDTRLLKPSPEPVLLAVRLLDVDRSGAWMIGDSPADIEAARSAGIRSVGLGDRAVDGDLLVDSIQELTALLMTMTGEDEDSSQ